jgi:DNA mismatch repair protein MutL
MVVTDLTQRIHKLSTALANQIAAGEVINRPASVVKELLENSLDAGASKIKLDIRKGGRLLISVQDNGVGIHPDDLPLALAQHATSKLTTQTDLERINTLGFRGEALSSIASVSRLELSSRIADEEHAKENHARENHGWSINVTPGDALSEPEPAGMVVGTSVEVRDLFFNTPARRKFLRTDNTEFFHIREIVRRVALSRYDVSFHLKHNNKTVLQCSGRQKNFAERAQAIFGKKFLANSFELDYERNGLRLWGWFGHPEIARNQVDQQYFYLNGRVIRDKQVNHAIRMASQDYLYTGKHAVYVLFLEMDVSDVDVNVHPAKHEVRFRQARDVHDFIFAALMQACAGRDIGQQNTQENNTQGQNTHEQDIQEQGAQYSFSQDNGKNYDRNSGFQSSLKSRMYGVSSNKPWNKTSSDSNDLLLIEGRYLITQIQGELLLIDVPLCQEIVASSKLENDFATKGIRHRPLLVPLTMIVSVENADFVESRASAFESFGLKLERVAPDSLLIREIPLLLEYADITSLINDMLPLIKSDKSSEQIISVMSGHVHDAGPGKIDEQMVTQLMDEVRSTNPDSSLVEKVKRGAKTMAWRTLDNESLSDLLKRKI